MDNKNVKEEAGQAGKVFTATVCITHCVVVFAVLVESINGAAVVSFSKPKITNASSSSRRQQGQREKDEAKEGLYGDDE